jgi:hypothetical protein
MSESMSLTIEIGGVLPAKLMADFFDAMKSECYDIVGPDTHKSLYKEAGRNSIKWYAQANYGSCKDLKAFCIKHKLGYIHHVEAKYEYNAELYYWVPGMKNEVCLESNQDSDSVISIDKVRPLVELLLEYTKTGKDALPLFVGTPGLEKIIERGCKRPTQILPMLEKELKLLLPGEPRLPPFTIKD